MAFIFVYIQAKDKLKKEKSTSQVLLKRNSRRKLIWYLLRVYILGHVLHKTLSAAIAVDQACKEPVLWFNRTTLINEVVN